MLDLLGTDELDAIHKSQISLAENIRTAIMRDIEAGKFSDYELAGRLGKSLIGIQAMKSRNKWTLNYAISVAHRLGYQIGKIKLNR